MQSSPAVSRSEYRVPQTKSIQYLRFKYKMAEQIIYSANPFKDAKAWVTRDGTLAWTFAQWTHPIAGQQKVTGLSGTLANGANFTLRHDWDANHGYHVNAMVTIRGQTERRLYKNSQVMKFDTQSAAIQRYDTLTEKVNDLGAANAARWFME
ncbi:hypothetical protein KCU78_g1607, partial [Aureobasidium melanogenum]